MFVVKRLPRKLQTLNHRESFCIYSSCLLQSSESCHEVCLVDSCVDDMSIQVRKLDVYFEMEEKMMSKQSLDKSLMDMFSDPEGLFLKSII